MPAKPRSAEYFDGWYANQAAAPIVAEIMNRHMGFPPGDDPALRSLHEEGVRSLQWATLLRRVLAVATNPQ